MVDRTYEEWKADEDEYKRSRRRRTRSVSTKAQQVWDSVDPPTKFADLIPAWQGAVTRYVRMVSQREGFRGAWDEAAPGGYSRTHLTPEFERALREVAEDEEG